MEPKSKNIIGRADSKQNKKGEAFGYSSGREPVRKFGKKVVERYGWESFKCQKESKYMGDEYVNEVERKPPYKDIRHTLCGVESTVRWERSKDTGRHSTLNFANFNQVARVWLKIVCTVLLPTKHLKDVTRDRVILVYMFMKGMPINVGTILRQNMMKSRNILRWRFCYERLITHFLRTGGIEDEAVDLTVAFHPNLMGKIVDVTQTKALDTSHGPVLSAQERKPRDDSVMARMFGIAKLQLRIAGRPITDKEMETLADHYPLMDSATFLCRTGPLFWSL
ncbi:hypothetical protein H5410_021084 [Solanum commersonii]|uniref:Putative plant transposon protein domain-containing protein n=1 Tax=Solanum commersonii TaxID=4109 RepID=A0A9J5Z9Y8_SOLCO|nr:hypothetical protein H5410_021084 [Solanum commersonii]